VEELRALRDQMKAMLKEGGPPPTGKWKDLEILEPVREYKARHASTLLTFEATLEAVEQALEKAGAA
jgi:NifU-like protein involved in Fe-S cluster formation